MPSSLSGSLLTNLSTREREVLQLAIAGKTSKLIALELSISYRTVEIHRSRILQKTGASNLTELLDKLFTEHEELGKKLVQSETRFNLFLNALPAIAFIKDELGKLVFCNKSFEESLGVRNWQDNPVKALFKSDVASKMSTDDRRALRAGQLITEEEVANSKGELRLYQTHKFRIPMPDTSLLLGGFSLDITEKRMAEVELKKTQEHFLDAQQLAHLGSWSWNVATGKLIWTDEQYRIYGYVPDTIIPTYDLFINSVVTKDRARVEADLSESLDRQSEFNCEFQISLPDGSLRNILARGKVERESASNSMVMTGANLDITYIKLADEARQSNERLLTLIKHTPAALAMFDRDMRYLSASRRWIEINSLCNREFIGISHYELFPTIPERWKEVHSRCLAGEILREEEDSYIREDGSVQWVRWEVQPWLTANDEVGGIVMFSEDITERKNVEARLRNSELMAGAILNSLSANIAILDDTGTIVAVNEKWRSFAKANSASHQTCSCEGVNYLAVCDKASSSDSDDAKKIAAGIRAVINGELPEFTLEYPCHSPGTDRWFNARVTPISAERISHVVVSHETITERKKAEIALRVAAEALKIGN